MGQFLVQLSALLTTFPQNLSYYLVLAFSAAGALQAALHYWRDNNQLQYKRMTVGLLILLACQFILFFCTGLAWLGLFDAHLFLAPLDRALTLFSRVWIVWLWGFPRTFRPADIISGIVSLLILVFLAINLVIWSVNAQGINFNTYWLEYIWQIMGIGLALIGCIGLLVRKPPYWGVGLTALLITLIGHSGQVLTNLPEGDFPGVLRFALIISYPILLILPQREGGVIVKTVIKTPEPLPEKKPTGQIPVLSEETDPQKKCEIISKTIAEKLEIDRCHILSTPDWYGHITIYNGFDLLTGIAPGATLSQPKFPGISDALTHKKIIENYDDEAVSEFTFLCEALGLTDPGSALLLPLTNKKSAVVGGLLLMTPYSKKTITAAADPYLNYIAPSVANILQQIQESAAPADEHKDLNAELLDAQAELTQLRQANEDLLAQIEILSRSALAENPNDQLAAMMAAQHEATTKLSQLQKDNAALQAELTRYQESEKSRAEQTSELEGQLRMTLEEIAHTKNMLAESNAKLMALTAAPGSAVASEQIDQIRSLTQDLSQPVFSIVGYTDLLLEETVGNLDALQRRFLDRIKVSTGQLKAGLDHILQITAPGGQSAELLHPAIKISPLIDNASAAISPQLLEKKINLNISVANDLPEMIIDQDAVQQMIISLLQHLIAYCTENGTINLEAGLAVDNHIRQIHIQASGAGIKYPAEEIQQLYAQSETTAEATAPNTATNKPGGLSVTKTLAEALGGNLWVDNEANKDSVVNVLLPTAQARPVEDKPAG